MLFQHQQIYNKFLVEITSMRKNTTKMVESTTGSIELKKSLPYGAMRKMAHVFGVSDYWVSRVVAGEVKGNKQILECAVRISELETEKQKETNKILNDYGNLN